MAKLPYIEFANGFRIPILHEDRNVIAIDKPQGWMLAPVSWQSTGRNLFAALTSSVNAGDFWARSRNLKFIRFAHRLDADTSGVLLLVKAPGAVPAFTELFEERNVEKVYLAVVRGVPEVAEWKCRLRIAPMQERPGRMEINNAIGKDCETLFRVIDKSADRSLVMCWPLTGRTHQIRLHLAAVGHPIWGDELYGTVPVTAEDKTELNLGLRAIRVSYKDPFMAERVTIEADSAAFVKTYGFDPSNAALRNVIAPDKALEHPKARLVELRRAEKEKQRQDRDQRRAVPPEREAREFRPRPDFRRDEDSTGFGSGEGRASAGGLARGRPARRDFGRGGSGETRSGARRPFDGSRKFERREGGEGGRFGRGSGPEAGRGGGRGEGARSFGPRSDRSDRGAGFRGRSGGKPAYGRPFEERGERRPFGGGGFRRDREEGDDRGNREGANEGRHGLIRTSSKFGLQAGFQKQGGFGTGGRGSFRSGGSGRPFGTRGGERPFRPRRDEGPGEGGRRPGQHGGGGGGFGKKPFRKFGADKPAWGRKPAGRPFRKFQRPGGS